MGRRCGLVAAAIAVAGGEFDCAEEVRRVGRPAAGARPARGLVAPGSPLAERLEPRVRVLPAPEFGVIARRSCERGLSPNSHHFETTRKKYIRAAPRRHSRSPAS